MTIEEKLNRLEEIVGKLEDGGIPLEEALQLFEEGVQLAKEVKEELEGARARIQEVVKKAEGMFEVRDFEV